MRVSSNELVLVALVALCTVVVYSDRCNAVELGRVKKPKSCRIGTFDKVMAYCNVKSSCRS